jgi:protein gp37
LFRRKAEELAGSAGNYTTKNEEETPLFGKTTELNERENAMGETTKISWCDKTFNPFIGCSKVHSGCLNCYSEAMMDTRYHKVKWGVNGTRVVTGEANWSQPIKWNRLAACVCRKTPADAEHEAGCPQRDRPRVFCVSLADVFEDWQGQVSHSSGIPMWLVEEANGHPYRWAAGHVCEVPGRPLTLDDIRKRLFAVIDATPNLDWLLLTKRPENIPAMWPRVLDAAGPNGELMNICEPRQNVWLGTSVSLQEHADKQIPELLKCRDLSPVLFISAEPLLGPIDLCWPKSMFPDGPPICCYGRDCGCMGLPTEPPVFLWQGLDWVIAGGESGQGFREMPLAAIESLADQCTKSGVAFHCKQDSALHSGTRGRLSDRVWNLKQFPKVRE